MCAVNYLDVPSIEKKCSYRLGDHAKACDMRASDSERENIIRASLLKKGDGAFVLRSDNTWRFAIVTQKVLGEAPHIDFILNEKGSMKCLTLKHWASNVRSFQSSRSGKMNQFMDSLDSYSEIAEETQEEIATSQCLKELVNSQCFKELNLSMLANDPSIQEDGLDDSRRTSDPSLSWNQPPPPEITVQRRGRKKDRSYSFDSTATTNMNDHAAATKEDTDQGEERKNKTSDTETFLQSQPEGSKSSRKDETRSRDRKSCPEILSYQQVKCGQTTTRKMRRNTFTPLDKTNDEKRKMKSLRASVKCTSVTKFQSLFEECMHA